MNKYRWKGSRFSTKETSALNTPLGVYHIYEHNEGWRVMHHAIVVERSFESEYDAKCYVRMTLEQKSQDLIDFLKDGLK